MNTHELARGLLNYTRYTTTEPETGDLWTAYRGNFEDQTAYIVMRPEINSTLRDLVTFNEDEAAHYMIFIADEWTVQP